jgi:ABC-type multidrug transport system ATPase subunit
MINEIPTVIMCTHSLNLANDVCIRGIVMDGGEIVYDGPISEAISHYKDLTSGSINRIEFAYNEKVVSKQGVTIDIKEFKELNDIFRLVIYDQNIKDFIITKEFGPDLNLVIERRKLPTLMNCKFKIQQCKEGQWYDSSRYIQLIEKTDGV